MSLIVFTQTLFFFYHCLLNHPFLLHHRLETSGIRTPLSFLVRSFDYGRICARQWLRHLQDAKAAGCSMNASFYSYCSVVTGSIQALYLHSTDGNLRQDAMVCIQLNLVTPEELGRFWENLSGSLVRVCSQSAPDTHRPAQDTLWAAQ